MIGSGSRPPGSPTQNGWGPMVQVALEQSYPPERRITHDPLVVRFLPPYMKLLVKVGGSNLLREPLLGLVDCKVPGVRGGVLCRKRAIDDQLAEALDTGLEAAVILGAGMDTRACRMLDRYAIPVYEVDLPETIDEKRVTLRRVFGEVPAHIRLVVGDLERQDVGLALEAAGLAPGCQVFFIMEGVSQYISEVAVQGLLASIRPAGPGSRLAFTYIRKDFLDGRAMYGLENLYRLTRVKRETWKFGLDPDEVAEFISRYGWREVEQWGSDEYVERYVRPAGRQIAVMVVERLVFAEKV